MTNHDDALYWKNRALKAEDRMRELEGVLEPFAHFGRFCNPDHENYEDNRSFSSVNLTCGMMRCASQALAK